MKCLMLVQLFCGLSSGVSGALPETIQRVKGSVVAIGTYQKTRSPAFVFRGTGFAVSDGTLIATNAHVLPEQLASHNNEILVVFAPHGADQLPRAAEAVAVDRVHDLAVLRIQSKPFPPLEMHQPAVEEGQVFAFTGFPVGPALGFAPVTHRALVSSLTAVALPALAARQLDSRAVARLRAEPVPIMQLDATAYPGNSGSPLYDTETGAVAGVINMVLVRDARAPTLSPPTGLSFAIPIRFLRDLLQTIKAR